MADEKIRLNIDYINRTPGDALSTLWVNSSETILNKANDYDLVVEKMEIPLTKIPIFIDDRSFKFLIDVKDVNNIPPGMTKGYNELIMPTSTNYFSIDDVLQDINKFLGVRFAPYQVPKFSIDWEKRLLKININNVNEATLDLFDIHIDARMTKMFSHFSYGQPVNWMNREVYYQLLILNEIGVTYQARSSVNDWYKFKSVRLYSTLPTQSYFIYSQDLNILRKSRLLTEIILNSSDYDEQITNLLYIPQQFKKIELVDDSIIKDFSISFMIHYANGKNYELIMAPEAYISLTLLFEKKNALVEF